MNQLSVELGFEIDDIANECDHNNDGTVRVFDIADERILIHYEVNEGFTRQIIETLKAYHKTNYLFNEGMEPGEFYGKLGIICRAALL